MSTKSCTSNGGIGCSRGFVREKCHKCNLGSISCDMCHVGSLVTQHNHHHHQQQQQSRQQKRRGGKENNTRHQHQHHRLSSSSSTSSSSSSRSSSACSTPTTGSPRSSLSIEASAFPLPSHTTPAIAGCAPLGTTTMTKMVQRAGSGSGPTGATSLSSAVNSALVLVPSPQQSSSFSAGGPQSLSPVPYPPALPHSQISSPRPKMTIKTLSISYQLPLPSGHPQKSLVSSSPVSPIPSKDISLAVITDCPYPSYTRSAPSSPTANITGLPSFATSRLSSTSSPPPFLPPHPSLSISSSIPTPSSPTTTAPTSNPRPTPLPPPSSSSYSVPSSPSPYGPSSLPCIFCFNGRKACEECFGLGYVQRICQECLRDRHRQQNNNNRRRMKHTSLPDAWNQFGTKIKEQLFSHSFPAAIATAAAASSHTATPGTTTATPNTTTIGTNGNASSQPSSSSPFSTTMLFLPLQRRNTSANAQPRGNVSPTATTATTTTTTTKTGIAGLSLKNKFPRQERSKSMVSLPLTTNSLSSLSGPTSCPTTPTANASPPSSSLVPSTALVDTASSSISTSNAMIVTTPGSGVGPNLRPVEESEGEGGCEGAGSTDRNINSSASEEEMEEDDEYTGVALGGGKGKMIAGHVEPSSNNKNNQLIPPPSTQTTTITTTKTTTKTTTTPTVTTTVKKSFKATVMGALKLPNLFQGHLHTTTSSTTTDNNTNSNNSNTNNDNNRSSRRRDRGDKGVRGGDRGSMNHVSGRNNNNANNNTHVNNSSNGGDGGDGGRVLHGHVNNNRGRGGGGGEGGRGRGSRVPQRRQWSLSLPSLSMSGFPSALTVA